MHAHEDEGQRPGWWSDYHESTWQRVKEALRRDWEQTKADLTRTHGHPLNQTLLDTVKQAAGSEPLPLFTSEPTHHAAKDHWYHMVHAVRYGYAAAAEYADHEEWDERLESKLQAEWEDLKTNHAWDEVQAEVRWAWHGARRPPEAGGDR